MTIAVWLWARLALACDASDLASALDLAEERALSLDAAGFAAAREAIREQLACQQRPLQPELAGEVHAVEAVAAFAEGDRLAMLAAARGAALRLGIERALTLPSVRPGSELHAALATVGAPSGSTQLPRRRGAIWLVDGIAADEVPRATASVLQLRSAAGLSTWYLPEGVVDANITAAVAPRGSLRAWPLGAASAGSGAVAVGLLTGAAISRTRIRAGEGDLDRLLSTNRALGVGGYALAGVSAACAAGAVAVAGRSR